MPKINLTLEKLMCPICRGIVIEPVTMPCAHTLCLDCFNGTMEMANLTCPLCRKRVGGWLRTAKKLGKLVNADLWTYVQTNFGEYVRTKQRGEDDDIEDELEGTAPPPVRISQPGEIRKEFESCQAKLEEELRIKQEAELKASEEFIKQLQEEEERTRQEREEEDERIARELQAKLEQEAEESMQTQPSGSESPVATLSPRVVPRLKENKENKPSTSTSTSSSSSVVRGPIDAFLSKGKPLQGSSCNTPQPRSEEVARCDSITSEILHFKPINIVPVTPPKTMPDGRVLQVQLIRATPVNLLQVQDSPTATSSPTLVKQLSTLQMERKSMLPPQTSDILTQESMPSAFKGFQCASPKSNPVLDLFNSNKLKQKSKTASSTVTSNSLLNESESMDIDTTELPQAHAQDNSRLPSYLNEEISNTASTSINNNKYFSLKKQETDQEYKDFLLAQQLQEQFNLEHKNLDGSNSAYQFRNRTHSSRGIVKKKSGTQQRKRSVTVSSQPTLRDAFRRAANKNSQ